METIVWLKVSAKKWGSYSPAYRAGSVQAFKSKPTTNGNEVAIRLSLSIPDSVFSEPVFEAKVTLPDSKKEVPITAEIQQNVQKVLSDKMGFRVKVSVADPTLEEVIQ